MTRTPPRSLRKLMLVATIVITTLATCSAGALIAATNLLERTTEQAAAAAESVRLVEEAEIKLLLFARTADPLVRHELDREMVELLAAAQQHVTSPEEARVLRSARERFDEYRTIREDPAGSQTAVSRAESATFKVLQQLVAINLSQTQDAQHRAVSLNRKADLLGIGLSAAIIATSMGFVLWFRRRVMKPLYALADTMKRFGDGDRTVRSQELGALELREMSQRFNAMAESIATQREAQIAFLGGVAHDLRTPLSALRIGVDVLGFEPSAPPDARVIGVISRQLDCLERITGDFLDMSKIEAGRLDLRLARQDLRPIGRSVVELFANDRHRIELETAPDPVVLACDEVRISQAITNLVSNAVKYSPASEPIHVAIRSQGEEAVIEVADHGAGIAREDHQRIFEPFQRVGAKDAVPGTGLGLFNVKRLIEAHGGWIEVESALSRGSTFRIHLPLAAR